MNVIDRVAACRDALQRGQVVLVPTDTVYGIAAALDDEDAVQALYTLKGRPRSQPCQVLCFAPVALDPLLALQAIGYDVADPAAALAALRRHFLGVDATGEADAAERQLLLCLLLEKRRKAGR